MNRKELETKLKCVEQEIDLLACILNRRVWYGSFSDDRLETIRAALIDAEETYRTIKAQINQLEGKGRVEGAVVTEGLE